MPADKPTKRKRRTQVKDLPKQEKELTKEEEEKVKGGILPYVEQDNLRSVTKISDGTSNTIIK